MPELPEVETVRAGLQHLLVNQTISTVRVYQEKLRYPVPQQLALLLEQQQIINFERRAKYLLLRIATGTVIIHLGMSGSLCWHNSAQPAQKHDHVDFLFENGACLRYRDPRRFGLILWHPGNTPLEHRLLSKLGPEPLSDDFHAEYLFNKSRQRRRAIKTFLMDNHIVVGVGNIYANEALFKAGIHPERLAVELTMEECCQLVYIVREVLAAAIKAGGTTLQDFVNGHGSPGYFQQQLFVYGREGQPCLSCGTTLVKKRIGQRSAFFCSQCQPYRD
ncbi:MAG: bifunctional DNA-formamidopyrimidine glycosylase/DNA-(apurinic or apyrimidinic site) lyase [Thermodesulfobacteriota bacterium]|nr:bifunctional DNA-formamidopyrimidine glycosylase/DNA-(apurinic or apyrimidinic site) lyase [Thermodesulfobacteriota bacterium]